MKCGFVDCNEEAIGEAYFPGIDKWHPLCRAHYGTHKRGGMKVRLFEDTGIMGLNEHVIVIPDEVKDNLVRWKWNDDGNLVILYEEPTSGEKTQ